MKLSENALFVLKQRYLQKDENGEVCETPEQMFDRVAKSIAEVEIQYKKEGKEINELKNKFYKMMTSFDFLPNSPTLMNAGTELNQLSACFMLPVEDDMDSIFEAVKNTAMIHKSGGGTGFSFSKLRPKDDIVKTTGGIASGPLSFMRVFDCATDVIKQGGKRRGANMGVMRIDHPDILDFIVLKEKEGVLTNFNISVAITDKFMRAVKENKEFPLINPRNGKVTKKVSARALWNLIIMMAWKNGEPGILFIDEINRKNPTPEAGDIEATNPCGEQPLLSYESCNLGSINLSNFIVDKKIDYERLREIIRLSIRFLDNVIDINKFPLQKICDATKANRKIGLGVMGFADTLVELGIRYNSEDGIEKAKEIMKFIQNEAKKMSMELGKEKGNFPNFDKSIFKNKVETMRNATVTTIAPTGSISIIANCSSGIEPIFSLVYYREVEETLGKRLIEVNPIFQKVLIDIGREDLIKMAKCDFNSVLKLIPKEIKELLVTSKDTTSEQHVKIQSAFQKYVDNAVSKTVNLPNGSTIDEIESIFVLAYELECKGITLYRDGSRKYQLLVPEKQQAECPVCSL